MLTSCVMGSAVSAGGFLPQGSLCALLSLRPCHSGTTELAGVGQVSLTDYSLSLNVACLDCLWQVGGGGSMLASHQ